MWQGITVTDDLTGKRLDLAVRQVLTEHSRSTINKLINNGDVRVNSKLRKSSYKLNQNDAIEIKIDSLDITPEAIEIPILYEDQDVIVINKPPGILTHSKHKLDSEASVASWLVRKQGDMPKKLHNSGIVHRLDRPTSGVMICSKHAAAHKFLQKQFSNRKVTKIYCALVSNKPKLDHALIDVAIKRDPKHPSIFKVDPNGKPARTYYKVLGRSNKHYFIELRPETGRTHQLRLHLKYINCPILGDYIYQGKPASRLMLHSKELIIELPSKQQKHFIAHLPAEFEMMEKDLTN